MKYNDGKYVGWWGLGGMVEACSCQSGEVMWFRGLGRCSMFDGVCVVECFTLSKKATEKGNSMYNHHSDAEFKCTN